MKVAVLGATGFIGSWVVRALAARGAEVTAIARKNSDTWRLARVDDVQILRSDDWPAAVAALGADTLVSLDWDGVSAAERNDSVVQQANIARQAEILTAALSNGVSRVVGVGSQAEYGPVSERVLESHPLRPITAYGHAKVAASESLERIAGEFGGRWSWARVFSVFGPLESGDWLLPTIARGAAEGRVVALSSGEQRWSYLYAADAGSAIAELALSPDAEGIYNVGHPTAPALRDSIELFAEAVGATDLIEFGVDRGSDLEPDTTRLEALGWSPTWGAVDAFRATADWMRNQPVSDPFGTGQILPAGPSSLER